MKIRFLGTNGWYSSSTGLTPCVLIDSEEGYIVLDAGEGIQKLDEYVKDKPVYLFISHSHLDHTHGLHILDKFSFKELTIIGKPGIKKSLDTLVRQPYTSALKDLPYKASVLEVAEGEHESPLSFKCKIFDHPDPSMGYRFRLEGKEVSYCTDMGMTDELVEFVKGSDILISECAFGCGDEINPDWPHMNPEIAANLAKRANVKKLFLMHFDAYRYHIIEQRKEAEASARKIFKNTTATIDDMEVKV